MSAFTLSNRPCLNYNEFSLNRYQELELITPRIAFVNYARPTDGDDVKATRDDHSTPF